MPNTQETSSSSGANDAKPSATTNTNLPIYLDYASTTPLDPQVREAMLGWMGHDVNFGNPSATTHRYGWQAQAALEQSRAAVAEAIGAPLMGVYFTGGATESINLALKGLVAGLWQGSVVSPRWSAQHAALPHVITSAAEHKATLDALAFLATEKRITLSVLTPSARGTVSAEQIAEAFRPETVLVSVLHVNNELGVINPLSSIAAACQEQGVFLHVDAVQSLGKTAVCVADWGADLVSFSGHKVYGPKGIGVLFVSEPLRGQLVPLAHGGGQERGLRPGTVPMHQVVGMATACELAAAQQAAEYVQYTQWRTRFLARLAQLPDWVLHSEGADCVPNILSLGFHGVTGETLLMALKDIAISSGSACNSVTLDPSHVLMACGIERELAASTVRLSFGRFSDETQLLQAAEHIDRVVSQLRG